MKVKAYSRPFAGKKRKKHLHTAVCSDIMYALYDSKTCISAADKANPRSAVANPGARR